MYNIENRNHMQFKSKNQSFFLIFFFLHFFLYHRLNDKLLFSEKSLKDNS